MDGFVMALKQPWFRLLVWLGVARVITLEEQAEMWKSIEQVEALARGGE